MYEYVAVAWLMAQTLKVMIRSLHKRKFVPHLFLVSGGMPSAHSALVTALTAVVGLTEGLASPIFAMTLVFSLIVIYDAVGHHALRRHSGLEVIVGIMIGLITVMVPYLF